MDKDTVDKINRSLSDETKRFIRSTDNIIRQTEHLYNARNSNFSNVITFNSILLSAFAIIVSINNNSVILKSHILWFFILCFIPILLIMINFYFIRHNYQMKIRKSIHELPYKTPLLNKIIKRIPETTQKNKKSTKNINGKIILWLERISYIISITNFIYFIIIIKFFI